MAADGKFCAKQILRMRIGFAIRRATGKVVDVDAMLSRPHLLARRLDTWRSVGSTELNSLIDELELEIASEPRATAPVPRPRTQAHPVPPRP